MEGTIALEARLYLDQQMVETGACSIAGGNASVVSQRCPTKSTPNEDAVAVIPLDDDSGVLVVADGVGGCRNGEEAAAIAVRAVRDAVASVGPGSNGSLRTAILDGMESANLAIQALGLGAATTLAIVEIQGKTIRPYHVGDSLILVTGQRGKLKLQTVSHSPVGFAIEAGVLDEAAAMQHEDRHLVSNLVGNPAMRIEIGAQMQLAPRDTLLLASDGLSDNLLVEEIIEHSRKGPLDKAVMQLANEAHERMLAEAPGQPSKPDDLTIVAYRLRK